MRFDEFDFEENLLKGIQDAGFETCTDVQEETFKILKESRDVLAQSQTGTGKTAAFLIGMFQQMKLEEGKFKGARALVIVPTRELAIQVEREALLLGSHLDLKIGSFYGGVGYQQQEDQLKEGLDLMIGTPGRLIDFGKSKKLDFSKVGILVIDEADRLFDMGFYPDITFMMKRMSPPSERLTMLFSATMSTRVANLSWEHMNQPGEIIIEPEQITVDAVKQELYHVGANEKMSLLLGILKRDKPEAAVIFCNTRGKVYEVAKRLEVNGYKSKYLIGDLPQKKRTQVVDAVKRGEVPFLVATDVAARGLHIDDLPLVVNYDVPNDAENYVHRIGRTARAGKNGHAITLACEEFVLGLSSVEEYIESKIPVVWAEEELYSEDQSRGMKFRLSDLKRDGTIPDRGDRKGGNGDRRGGNRSGGANRGTSRERSGQPRSDRNRRPSTKVASVVSQAAGSMETFEKGKGSKKNKSSQNRTRHDKSRNDRVRNDKDRNDRVRNDKGRNEKGRYDKRRDQKTPQPEKNISSESSLDSRLDYYRKKYGEDFKPTDVKDLSGKKGGKKKKKPAPKNQSRKTESRDNGAKQDSSKPKKKGFFSKLFGG